MKKTNTGDLRNNSGRNQISSVYLSSSSPSTSPLSFDLTTASYSIRGRFQGTLKNQDDPSGRRKTNVQVAADTNGMHSTARTRAENGIRARGKIKGEKRMGG